MTVPLLNLQGKDIAARKVGKLLRIAPFTDEDKTQLWDEGFGLTGYVSISDFISAKYKLIGTFTEAKEGRPSQSDLQEDAERVITALRFLKVGDVGTPAIIEVGHGELCTCGHRAGFPSDLRPRRYGRPYELSKPELASVSRLVSSLLKAAEGSRLSGMQVSLRRFNQAYGRENAEDRIIDLTIALESCLLKGADDELTYRLSLRGAALLGNVADPHETQSLLATMYGLRSKIVHEGMTLDKVKERHLGGLIRHEVVRHCEDITRRILSTYVARLAAGESIANINKALDEQIVSSLRSEARKARASTKRKQKGKAKKPIKRGKK